MIARQARHSSAPDITPLAGKLGLAEAVGLSLHRRRTFVLIHGTWHGGWAWKDVIRHLSQKGHTAYAPTLAGHGPGVTRSGIKHADCVDSVAEYIQLHDLKRIVLVGHSFGGTVVQKVAERFPERIARIVSCI